MSVHSIEIGYGTTSVVTASNNNSFVVRTFPSVPVPVKSQTQNLGADVLSAKKTVTVPVGDNLYEIGEDVHSSSDPRSTRVLNTEGYIDSERYKALFLGSLKMIPEDEIGLLVCGLPVSVMPRANELKELVEGEHDLGNGRKVTVKSAWIIAQPLGGLLAYAREGGQERFKEMKNDLKSKQGLSYGFGFAVMLLTAIPFVNLIVMPVAVCGATRLWVDNYRPKYRS